MRANSILLFFISALFFEKGKNINATKASLYPFISILFFFP